MPLMYYFIPVIYIKKYNRCANAFAMIFCTKAGYKKIAAIVKLQRR